MFNYKPSEISERRKPNWYSENDVDRLKLLFGLLNYEVLEPEKDLDENELMKTFDNFVTYINNNNSSYNSLVLVIMSHGSRDKDNRDYIIDKKGNQIYVIILKFKKI